MQSGHSILFLNFAGWAVFPCKKKQKSEITDVLYIFIVIFFRYYNPYSYICNKNQTR